MLGSSLRMLPFRLGIDGPFRSTKQGGLSDFVSHTMQFLVSSSYGTVFSSSKIKPENRVLLYTLKFARAFGIYLLQFLLDFVLHTRQLFCALIRST